MQKRVIVLLTLVLCLVGCGGYREPQCGFTGDVFQIRDSDGSLIFRTEPRGEGVENTAVVKKSGLMKSKGAIPLNELIVRRVEGQWVAEDKTGNRLVATLDAKCGEALLLAVTEAKLAHEATKPRVKENLP